MGLLDSEKVLVTVAKAKLKLTKTGKRVATIELLVPLSEWMLAGLPASLAAQFAVMSNPGGVMKAETSDEIGPMFVRFLDITKKPTLSLSNCVIGDFKMEKNEGDIYLRLSVLEVPLVLNFGGWLAENFGTSMYWTAIPQQGDLLSQAVKDLTTLPEGIDSMTLSTPGHEPVTIARKKSN